MNPPLPELLNCLDLSPSIPDSLSAKGRNESIQNAIDKGHFIIVNLPLSPHGIFHDMSSGIQELQNELASKVHQLNASLATLKSELNQELIDLAECRTFLNAWSNTCRVTIEAEKSVFKLSCSRDDALSELRSSSEETFKKQSDAESISNSLRTLTLQLMTAEENNECLTSTLTKLKSKHDTHRMRANGAEAELLATKRRLAEENTVSCSGLHQDKSVLDSLNRTRENAQHDILATFELLKSEIQCLRELLQKQSGNWETQKRPKLTI